MTHTNKLLLFTEKIVVQHVRCLLWNSMVYYHFTRAPFILLLKYKVLRLFYVLLTVYLGIIFANNQPDAQFFFMYVYFYSLHVSGSCVPIIRRIVSVRHLVYVTLYR
jgi:hypothetical protein